MNNIGNIVFGVLLILVAVGLAVPTLIKLHRTEACGYYWVGVKAEVIQQKRMECGG